GDELLHRERLHEVVVGADLERVDAVVLRSPCGDDDDRRRDPFRANRLDQLPAVEPGQHEIEDAGVRLLVAEAGESLFAVADPDRLEPGGGEVAGHPLGDDLVVLDDEHLRHRHHYRDMPWSHGSPKGDGLVKGWRMATPTAFAGSWPGWTRRSSSSTASGG